MLRNTPPAAANRPRLTSGSPNDAASDATTTSQPRSSSKPPATAVALAAPTMGTPISPCVKRTKPFIPSGLPPTLPPSANARRSMPAQKAFSPVPVRTTARTSGSFSASVMPSPIAVSSSGFNELRASGRLSRRTRTGPLRSDTSTGSDVCSVSPIGPRPSSLSDPRPMRNLSPSSCGTASLGLPGQDGSTALPPGGEGNAWPSASHVRQQAPMRHVMPAAPGQAPRGSEGRVRSCPLRAIGRWPPARRRRGPLPARGRGRRVHLDRALTARMQRPGGRCQRPAPEGDRGSDGTEDPGRNRSTGMIPHRGTIDPKCMRSERET